MKEQVTERDIRMPEFRDAKLEDLEFDASGAVVRKDRFEKSMRKIAGILHGLNGLSPRDGWTCEQVVDAVQMLKERNTERSEVIENYKPNYAGPVHE